jgi:hypothetical protein
MLQGSLCLGYARAFVYVVHVIVFSSLRLVGSWGKSAV